MKKSVNELLCECEEIGFPKFQRPFFWTEKECGDLWDDLLSKEEIDLGVVVCYPNKTKTIFLDGKQRLTAVISLLLALKDKVNDEVKMAIGTSIADKTIEHSEEVDRYWKEKIVALPDASALALTLLNNCFFEYAEVGLEAV